MDKILILDFGSQYTQLIARRVRELNIYSEIIPYHQFNGVSSDVKAIILSGSPVSVTQSDALDVSLDNLVGQVPVLAICYGAQYIAQNMGGSVSKSDKREYGKAKLNVLDPKDPLLHNVPDGSQIWMSHGDSILNLPQGFTIIGDTDDIPVAIYRSDDNQFEQPVYCLQFHPEVTHSLQGQTILKNFLIDIAQVRPSWTPASFVAHSIADIRATVGNDDVILGLSGGVDSSVVAMLMHQAIGSQMICLFIDNGLLRHNEYEEVLESYKGLGLNVIGVDAKEEFYHSLAGKTDPELKRKAIGHVFIDVFEREAKKFPKVKYLAQGTIYPDVIESISVHGPSVTIKSHHNVGGLPDKLNLKIIEPLRMLFKDEVRVVGAEVGLPNKILHRHPFPGPGLAIRILGEVTPERVVLLQKADAIYINNLVNAGWYDKVWQAGAILLPVKTVGVMGDERTYENAVALRAVTSIDGMTAEWAHLPYDLLGRISNEIINQVKGINRVVYDISTKPPATIEWE